MATLPKKITLAQAQWENFAIVASAIEYKKHNLRYETRQVPSDEEENGDYDSTGYNLQCDIGESDDDEMKTLCIEKKVLVKEKVAG